MTRLHAALAFLLLLVTTAAGGASIAIDPKALVLDPIDKALPNVCGVPASCPVCPVCPPGGGNPPTGGGTGGGNVPWNGTCAGFASTKLLVPNWQNPVRLSTVGLGGFGPDDALVVQFTTGNTPSSGNLPRLALAEDRSPPSGRDWAVSSKPCEFTSTTFGATATNTNSIQYVFSLGAPSGSFFVPRLELNTTYFLNVKNAANSTCTGTDARRCDMFVDLIRVGL